MKLKATTTTFGATLAFLILGTSLCPAQGRLAGPRARRQLGVSSAAQPNVAVPAVSTSYAFTLINFPGAPNSGLNGLNPSATATKQQLVGEYYGSAGGATENGFLLQMSSSQGVTREAFSTEDAPGTGIQLAGGINDAGQIVGFYWDTGSTAFGYELIGGSYITLSVPFAGAVDTFGYGIDNAGDSVGCWDTGGSGEATSGYELIGGTYTNLAFPNEPYTCASTINNKGEVAGFYLNADFETGAGFLFRGGKYTAIQVPGAIWTEVNGINDAGVMVGGYGISAQAPSQGFVLAKGAFSTIAIPGGSNVNVEGISNAGVICGTYTDSAHILHGFIGIPQ